MLLLMIFAFLTSCLVFYIILFLIYSSKIHLQRRIGSIKEMIGEYRIKDKKPSLEILNLTKNKIKEIIDRLTPKRIEEQIEKKLAVADYPFGLNVNRWMSFKFLFSMGFSFLLLFILQNVSDSFFINIIFTIIFACILWILPDVVLNEIIKNRKRVIINQLPDVLDLIVASIEAGLSFDGSLSYVVQNVKGELAQEMGRILNDIHNGKTRREAFNNMTKKYDMPDLLNFVSFIIQADQLGINIGKVLRIQATQIREKRRQRSREQAMKAPVKMLFPLIIFIFPTIFVVIFGPALIQLIDTFF